MKKGMIVIDPKFVLNWLQFPFGELLHAEMDVCGNLNLVITDYEMPNVETGNAVPVIPLTFITHQDCTGHKVSIRQPLELGNAN